MIDAEVGLLWDHEPRNGQRLEIGNSKRQIFEENAEGTKP